MLHRKCPVNSKIKPSTLLPFNLIIFYHNITKKFAKNAFVFNNMTELHKAVKRKITS